jgi:hypothetical protein
MNRLVVAVVLLFVVVVVILYPRSNKYVNDMLGGAGAAGKCLICKKVTYNGYITNWWLTHILLFAVLGFLIPKYSTILIVLGIVWEVIEFALDMDEHVVCLMTCHETPFRNVKEFWHHYTGTQETKKELYWSSGGLVGSMLDILADMFGVYVGVWLAHRMGSR